MAQFDNPVAGLLGGLAADLEARRLAFAVRDESDLYIWGGPVLVHVRWLDTPAFDGWEIFSPDYKVLRDLDAGSIRQLVLELADDIVAENRIGA